MSIDTAPLFEQLSRLRAAAPPEIADIIKRVDELVDDVLSQYADRLAALEAELETERLRLVACGEAALSNTHKSAARQRLPKDSLYWSASYQDVLAAVEREMGLRDRLAALEAQFAQMIARGNALKEAMHSYEEAARVERDRAEELTREREEAQEFLSEVVSGVTDGVAGCRMRCSPDLPRYVQNLEAAVRAALQRMAYEQSPKPERMVQAMNILDAALSPAAEPDRGEVGSVTLYEKRGRRYYPVAEREQWDAYPAGSHLVVCEPGRTVTRIGIEPDRAALLAAAVPLRQEIAELVMAGLRMRPTKRPITKKQAAAWEAFSAAMGREGYAIQYTSAQELADAVVGLLVRRAAMRDDKLIEAMADGMRRHHWEDEGVQFTPGDYRAMAKAALAAAKEAGHE